MPEQAWPSQYNPKDDTPTIPRSWTIRNPKFLRCFRVCANLDKKCFWIYGREKEEDTQELKRNYGFGSDPNEAWEAVLKAIATLKIK
eukprot:3558400-Karenia_brevis.AAC.1